MQPVRTPGATSAIPQPRDWRVDRDGPFIEQPARRDSTGRTPCVKTIWAPSADEVQRLVFGGAVELHHYVGDGYPVFAVTVGTPAKA